MAGFGAREARINQERKPRVNLCSCGEEIDSTELLCHTCYMEVHGYGISETELLCESCRRTGEEPILDMPTMPPVAS